MIGGTSSLFLVQGLGTIPKRIKILAYHQRVFPLRCTIFAHTGVNITSHGRPYLGAAIGTTREFVASHVNSKVEEWISCIQHLTTIAKSQPHAAFSALTHGLSSKWTYISRTIPNISDLLLPLDNAICSLLLPELTSQPPPSDLLTRLFALPARLGGLRIKIPSMASEQEYLSSIQATCALSNNILFQTDKYGEDTLTAQLHAITLTQKQGASIWLSALPLQEHGFSLHKGAYRDALASTPLRLDPLQSPILLCLWSVETSSPPNMPSPVPKVGSPP